MQRDGLLSILIPEEYGGGGQSLRTACVVLEVRKHIFQQLKTQAV
jgi:alkylation response protein AidB-like acyl-CoA dehydrogenase